MSLRHVRLILSFPAYTLLVMSLVLIQHSAAFCSTNSTSDAQILVILPESSAPSEFLAFEEGLSIIRNFTSSRYSWHLANAEYRITALGLNLSDSEPLKAYLSAQLKPAVTMPSYSAVVMEFQANYFVKEDEAARIYEETLEEQKLILAETTDDKDEYVTEFQFCDIGSEKSKQKGVLSELFHLKYEQLPPDWQTDSYVLSGNGNIAAFVPRLNGDGAFYIQLTFKAENAPDVRDLVRATLGVVLKTCFDYFPVEYTELLNRFQHLEPESEAANLPIS